MSRRRRVFLAFAIIVVSVLGIVVIGVATLTRTGWGRGKLVALVLGQVNKGIQGTMYVGRIDGSIFTGFSVDTFEIRDRKDSVFVAASRVRLTFDPRDLLDRRILLRQVRIGGLRANIFEDSVGELNFRRIFPSGPPGPPQEAPRMAWGQFLKVEDVIVDSASVTLTQRWSPDSSLTRTERDSVIAFNLARTDRDYWRSGATIYETRHWTNGHLELDSARLDDRQPGGRTFALRSLSIDESYPPFKFRNARGFIRIQGDSIWPDIPHFELPGSAGNATGKVWWGPGQPTRFDLTIESDTVSLADIAWIYPTLPTTGGGRMKLKIVSERDPRLIDYVITDMDVRSTDSRLRGNMTFAVGAPVMILKDVDMTAQPLDFRMVEQLAGEPLPYPWRGTITGSLIASGGPLTAFVVDTSDLVFRDANVPGAVTIGQLRGTMDILEPSQLVFSGVQVNLDQLDLRTLQFLMPTFPRLNGMIAGRATLDSSWLDVRFRNADLTHTDGTGPATRMVGAGRVTFGDSTTTYDIAMNAQPFSFTSFGRAYTETHIPLKGEYTGPLRIQGTTQDLSITTELRGPAGLLAYDGRVDGDSLGGYGVDGQLRFEGLDLRTLLDTAVTPRTNLTGTMTMAVHGDSLANLVGSAELALDRSRIDSVLVREGARLQVRFADGRMRLSGEDTLETGAARFVASGGLGLGKGVRDSLTIRMLAESLADVRRYVNLAPTDSLVGTVNGRITLVGSVDSLDVGGVVIARDFMYPGVQARQIRLSPALHNVTGSMGGSVNLRADTLTLGGVRFAEVDGDLDLSDGKSGGYSVLATEMNGPVLRSIGAVSIIGDTTRVRMDSLSLLLEDKRFVLRRPATVRIEPGLIVIDTVVLASNSDERILFAANLPDSMPISARLSVEAVPLSDVSLVAQTDVPLGGDLTASLDVTGTREFPRMLASATLNRVTAGDVKVSRVAMTGSYANRRLRAEGRILESDTTVLTITANYPIDLALRSLDSRAIEDTMRIAVQSPRVALSILEAFTTAVRSARGSFVVDAQLAGLPGRALLNGSLRVDSGVMALPGMGITIRSLNANLVAMNDTVRIETLSMVSGQQNGTFTASGWVAHPMHKDSVGFDLSMVAQRFHAIGLPRTVADLMVTADVTWRGTEHRSVARGNVYVDEGTIALPETSDKEYFSLEDWRELGIDSVSVGRLGFLPAPATRFLAGLSAENVRVAMGPDVWLRSQDANIKLAGSVSLTVDTASIFTTNQLAFTGELQTERGTYRLNVSPLQRTFQVESGTLRFNGDRGFNPDLDIRAVYTSRVINSTYGGRNDVRVGVRITGSLDDPRPDLYAADSLLGLSQSDLLSYVLFDQPSFSVGSGTNSAMALLLNTATSFAGSFAARYASGLVDFVQLQTSSQGFGGADPYSLGGAQLAVGRQMSDRLFVSLTSGLCQVGQLFNPNSTSTAPPLFSGLGAKVEYRFSRNSQSGVAFAYEPSFDKLVCGIGERGFSTAKKQVGFDIFRVWRR